MKTLAALLLLVSPVFAEWEAVGLNPRFFNPKAEEPTRPREPRMIFFTMDSCIPCRVALDDFPAWLRSLGKDWKIGDSVRDHIQIVDKEQRSDLAEQYGVTSCPSMVLVDGSNRKAVPYTGRQSLIDLFNGKTSTGVPEAAPTPYAEIVRALALLPKPVEGFIEFGCGSDARWCVLAVERWKCKATGIEIDHDRAEAAREHVAALGLSGLITIIEVDAVTTDVSGDVGACFLYQDTLDKLRPRLEKLRAFASYIHRPAGLAVAQSGDLWIYKKPVVSYQPRMAVWEGRLYSGPVCGNPNCPMCYASPRSIANQLAAQQQNQQPAQSQPAASATGSGHWLKHCNGRQCWYEWVAD